MEKQKLLIWADAPIVNTGFGRVTQHLCDYLFDSFDISILGINYKGEKKYDSSKYFIYSTSADDQLGLNRFKMILEELQPDIILLFQDIFNIFHLMQRYQEELKKYPKVFYFPVDGSPFSKVWLPLLGQADKLITYTDWAIQQIQAVSEQPVKIEKLYHGIDTTIFYPQSNSNIKHLRRDFGWEDKFVITNINRFQPRKFISLTLRVASMFIKGYKICKCGNNYPVHLTRCDLNNCPASEVKTIVSGHKDSCVYLHMNIADAMMGTSPTDYLTTHALNNGFGKDDSNKTLFLNMNNTYAATAATDSELNDIYNASNIVLSTSIGEGFGLSTAEALSTGTQVIVGKHSANFELTDNGTYGYLIPNNAQINFKSDSGHIRPLMDPKEILKVLDIEYLKWVENGKKKIVHHEYNAFIEKTFNWEVEGNKLKSILLETKKAV